MFYFVFECNPVVTQLLSLVWIFATSWTRAGQASLSFTVSQSLLRLMCIESVMPANHLILCRPLLLLPPIPPSIRVFSSESALHIRWPKYWSFSFSFSISLSNEYSGLISFRIDWFDFLAVQGTLQESSPAPQFESNSSLVLSRILLYGPTLTSIHDYWKNPSFDYTCGPLFPKWYLYFLCCLGGSVVKNLLAIQEMQKTWVWSLGWEDPLEEEICPCLHLFPSYLPWRWLLLGRKAMTNLDSVLKSKDICALQSLCSLGYL